MLSPVVAQGHQGQLIHEVHADDRYLVNTIDGEWFEILHDFPWEDYRDHAAAYYDALYEFNINDREPPRGAGETTAETKEEAKQRLLLARATMQSANEPPPPIIYQGHVVEFKAAKVDPMDLAPGVVPMRLVGKAIALKCSHYQVDSRALFKKQVVYAWARLFLPRTQLREKTGQILSGPSLLSGTIHTEGENHEPESHSCNYRAL